MVVAVTGSEPGASSKVTYRSSVFVMTTDLTVIFDAIMSVVSSPVVCAFCCNFSAVWMMTAAATAATRISAMKTIIAPIPIAATLSRCSFFVSCFMFFTIFFFFPPPLRVEQDAVKEHLLDRD